MLTWMKIQWAGLAMFDHSKLRNGDCTHGSNKRKGALVLNILQRYASSAVHPLLDFCWSHYFMGLLLVIHPNPDLHHVIMYSRRRQGSSIINRLSRMVCLSESSSEPLNNQKTVRWDRTLHSSVQQFLSSVPQHFCCTLHKIKHLSSE